MLLRFCFSCCLFFVTVPLFSQTANLSGIINHYAAVEAIDSCSGRLTVDDTTGFRPGNPILMIQMQGAEIIEANNFLYGVITTVNRAGRYERATIASVEAGAVYLQNRPTYNYNPAGKVQLVTIVQYTIATVTDTLLPMPWNGSKGGVLALEVSGTLTLNAPVNADGAGFRGGDAVPITDNDCNFLVPVIGYFFTPGNWRGATKGEGIVVVDADKVLGRGPQANGGGGGNDHNSGGGGGANITDGGNGGDNDEPGFLNCDGYYPGLGGINIQATQLRMYLGGGGGAGHGNGTSTGDGGNGGGIVYLKTGAINGTNPIVTARGLNGGTAIGDGGGGGGAGGSIWVDCPTPAAGLVINNRGGNGGNSDNFNQNRCFGPGGGGSGGRIHTNVPSTIPSLGGGPGIVVNSTNGCNGSNNGAEAGEAGIVFDLPNMPQGTEPTVLPATAAFFAFLNGTTVDLINISENATSYYWDFGDGNTSTLFMPQHTYGAEGTYILTLYAINSCDTAIAVQTVNTLLLPVAAFTVQQDSEHCDTAEVTFVNGSTGTGLSFNWLFPGGSPAASTALNPTVAYANSGVYNAILVVSNATGNDTIGMQVVVNIIGAPTAAFSYNDLSGGLFQFTNQSTSAVAWLWEFGDGVISTTENPQHTYVSEGNYLVTLTAWNACDTVQAQLDLAYFAPPQAGMSVPDTVFSCMAATVFFNNTSTGSGNQYQWLFPGGDPAFSTLTNPTVLYPASGNFQAILIATNFVGADTTVQDFNVQVLDFPVADFTTSMPLNGLVQFENFSLEATTYTWDFGDGSAAANTFNTTHQYAQSGGYVVTLVAANPCGASVLQQTIEVLVVGVSNAVLEKKVLVYPNPNVGLVYLDASQTDEPLLWWRLFTPEGRLMQERSVDLLAPMVLMDFQHLPAGLYFLEIQFETGRVVRRLLRL